MILDGGVSTHYPLRIAANNLSCRWGVKVGVSNCLGLGKEAEDELCEQEKGGHGDEAETSTMLYIRGDLVRMEETTEEYLEVMPGCTKNGTVRVALFNKMKTPRGTNGNSTLATREKGERMMQAKVDDLVEFLTNFDRLNGVNHAEGKDAVSPFARHTGAGARAGAGAGQRQRSRAV